MHQNVIKIQCKIQKRPNISGLLFQISSVPILILYITNIELMHIIFCRD